MVSGGVEHTVSYTVRPAPPANAYLITTLSMRRGMEARIS